MQTKMEPRTLGTVQISPTVQATASNYQRAERPRRAVRQYFAEPGRARLLIDVLQWEHGSCFR